MIGTDIISITRIQSSIEKNGARFLARIFTKKEIAAAKKYAKSPEKLYGYYAKRFAAKEALAKAIGCGIGKKISFTDIEILNNKSGQPYVVHSKKITAIIGKRSEIKISLSDDGDYAVAFVIISQIGTA